MTDNRTLNATKNVKGTKSRTEVSNILRFVFPAFVVLSLTMAQPENASRKLSLSDEKKKPYTPNTKASKEDFGPLVVLSARKNRRIESLQIKQSNARGIHNLDLTRLEKKVKEEMQKSATSTRHGQIKPITFKPWSSNKELPCLPPDEHWDELAIQNTPSATGFLYLKPYKTGSSTASGINIRIARNVARQQGKQFELCKTRNDHGPTFTPGKDLFHDRSKSDSVLWTIIREPTHRAISAFFHFGVTRHGIEPSDENFKEYLQSNHHPMTDYYLHALRTNRSATFRRGKDDPAMVVNEILQDFNFIGITERMDESIIVLMMLLNLTISDVMYLSAKKHGGLDDGGGPTGCALIVPSFVSPEMELFLQSKEWKDQIQNDEDLYNAVNQSLDLTIEALGKVKFQENLEMLQLANQRATYECEDKVSFPCTVAGARRRSSNETDCMWNDSGCGFDCLDSVAIKVGLR